MRRVRLFPTESSNAGAARYPPVTDKATQERTTAATIVVLGLVFTVVGLVRGMIGFWAPGVALAVAGAGWFAWRASR